MTDTERERLTTDQLAHPQAAERTTSEDERRPTAADLEQETPRAGAHASNSLDSTTHGSNTLDSTETVAGTGAADPTATPRGDVQQPPAQLLDSGELAGITRRWSDIQTAFVDSPQQAVQDADALVADLMQHLAQVFATERQQLEGQWSRGGTVSTEDLRVSLQRYRSFFQRLLSV
jgi:hypothetical protein